MTSSPARSAAFRILLKVERDRSYASELIHSPRSAGLSAADRRLTTELVMGVLRWRSLLDQRIETTSTLKLNRIDIEVLTALRLGAYQLLFLSRVPARAAIFDSVELVKKARKRSAVPFANAVLRKLANAGTSDCFRELAQSMNREALAQASAHPDWLVARWIEHYGFQSTREICAHDQTVPVVSFYLRDPDAEHELATEGVRVDSGKLVSAARQVVSGDLTATRAYRERRILIQDEASQLVALLVGEGKKILDCCAAPGGKTSLIASRNPHATVVASELHPHRARLLRSLVEQSNVRVIAADVRSLPLLSAFDRVLADVPCSGTGTLARNPEIKWWLNPDDLRDFERRQIAILRSAITQLAPGGRIVYSTCSLEAEENELVIQATLATDRNLTVIDCRRELERLRQSGDLTWNDLDSLLCGPYLRTLPGVHPCDGFFAAILERIAG